jgi:hypothetical protein
MTPYATITIEQDMDVLRDRGFKVTVPADMDPMDRSFNPSWILGVDMRGKHAPFWEHREGTPLPENGTLKTIEIDIEDAAELYPELYRVKGDRVQFETMVSLAATSGCYA